MGEEQEVYPHEPQHNWGKTVLRPRNEGEDLKIEQTVLKRRDRNAEYLARRAKKVKEILKAKRTRADIGLKTAESIVAKSLANRKCKHRTLRFDRNQIKKPKPSDESKVLIVVRNGWKNECKKVQQTLKSLRLKHHNQVMFLPNTPKICEKLGLVTPYCYWGYPTKELITMLVQKQAAIFADRTDAMQRTEIKISDNALVEEHFGNFGMLCIDDIVHCIYNMTEHFKDVMWKLRAFKAYDHRTANTMLKHKGERRGNKEFKINKMIFDLLGSN